MSMVWHVHLNKAPKKVPEDQMDRIMIQENPKHKKTLKESQKSRLFKVVVNFQPLRKKENKTNKYLKIQVPFMKPIK